jgi:hexosaminidase
MKALVLYGQRRGVRVIGEYDMPAHSSFGKSLPQLVSKSCPDQLDPTKPAVYTFLRRFLGEVVQIFPDPTLFLGGDEVHSACYAVDNETTLQDAPAVVDRFWQTVQSDVLPRLATDTAGRNRRMLGVWVSDMPGPGGNGLCYNNTRPCPVLPINTSVLSLNSTVVNAYQSNHTAAALIAAGFRTIASYGNYYLASGDDGGTDWGSRYTRDLCDEIHGVHACDAKTGQPGAALLGGMASAWGEHIDAANFDAVVWHSLLAVAEQWWSPAPASMPDAMNGAGARLESMACHMRTRHGVPVGSLQPGFCPADTRWSQR